MENQKLNIKFNDEEIKTLVGLTGQNWRFLTGDVLDEYPNHLSSWGATIIATDTESIRITIKPFDHELLAGDDDDLGQLSVDRELAAAKTSLENGEFSYRFAGQTILEVYVIRESIARKTLEGPSWSFTNDYGVAFRLDKGAVAICKGGYQGFFLETSMGSNLESLEIGDGADFWTNDLELGETYDVRRDFISIASQ